MSESGDTTPPAGSADTAGALLRAARQAQGLHVAALATALKVPPRKLEALENDRYEEFQGATFVRALAQAACRALKIDPAPVLERLPELDSGALSQLERGLNAPFRERGARRESAEMPIASRAALLVVVVLVLGTLAFLFWPANWHLPNLTALTSSLPVSSSTDTPVEASAPLSVPGVPASAVATSEPAFPAPALPTAGLPTTQLPTTQLPPRAPVPSAAQPSAPQPASVPGARAVASAPAAGALTVPAAPAVAAAVPGGTLLQLRANKPSWIEVVDGRSQVLLARTLAAGEAVGFDGVLPLRVKIGNVSGTDVSFRGRPVDLAPQTRDNVARLELK
ncbi:RodZ domain-containing protein [Ideonella sp.]|uniref:helix-turn-helix domain-containing protein n=1 Tax=Ideonella sp. TaxID=1929293 RepID=UPI0035B058F7